MTSTNDPTFIHRTSPDGMKPILIAYAGNAKNIQESINLTRKRYQREKAKALKTRPDLTTPLYGCGCNERHCLHCISPTERLKEHGIFPKQSGENFVVACDPEHTNVRDDCVECFERENGQLVLRVHLAYPESLNCTSAADQGARQATLSAFLAKSMNESTPAYLFDRSHDGNYTNGGFKVGVPHVALTVENVFDPVPSAEKYCVSNKESSVYVSNVTLTHTISDDALYLHLCPPALRGVPSGETSQRTAPLTRADKRALKTLVRTYKLAECQGWTKGKLFAYCSTTPVYGSNPNVAPTLRQRFYQDYHAQITQFCFQHLVSRALLRLADEYTRENPTRCLPLVCYLPYGEHVPVLKPAQVEVLLAQGCSRGATAGAPLSREVWKRVCTWAAKRQIPLLQMFKDLGMPLMNADDQHLHASSARYTPALSRDNYCIVISNKPMRDYTCLVNARCVVCMVLHRHDVLDVETGIFDAWVTYWSSMHSAVQWGRVIMVDGMLFCHMMRAFGTEEADTRTCIVNGRVCAPITPDGKVRVVFPSLNKRRYNISWEEGCAVPAVGSPVLFSARAESANRPSLRYMENGLQSLAQWKYRYVPEIQKTAV